MFIDLRETASPLELLWTIAGVVALGINLWLLRDVLMDARALDRRGQNGARKIAVRTAIGIQAGLTVSQVIAVVIGTILLLTAPDNPARPITVALVVMTVGILLVEALLTLVALFTRVRRAQLLAYLESTERDANSQRHVETMAELSHNTEITTEARDTAQQTHDELTTALRENTATTIATRDEAHAALAEADQLATTIARAGARGDSHAAALGAGKQSPHAEREGT